MKQCEQFISAKSVKNNTPKQHSKQFIKKYANVLKVINSYLSGLKLAIYNLYPGRESNSYDCLGHRILSPACLPIPPPGQRKKLLVNGY
jgi:hypothetical protein